MGTPRYASQQWLDTMKVVNAGRSLKLAGHLCSTRCEQVLQGDASFVQMINAEVQGTHAPVAFLGGS
jgi:hypothetical protein